MADFTAKSETAARAMGDGFCDLISRMSDDDNSFNEDGVWRNFRR